jgi:hypothetical protein
MRNAALFAGILLLLAAALTGSLTHPVLIAGAVVAAAVLGNAVITPGRRRAAAMQPVTAGGASARTPDVAYNDSASRPNDQDNRRELDDGLRMICDVMGARAAVLWRTDPANDAIRAVAAHGRTLPPMLALRGDPLAWVAREGHRCGSVHGRHGRHRMHA